MAAHHLGRTRASRTWAHREVPLACDRWLVSGQVRTQKPVVNPCQLRDRDCMDALDQYLADLD